MQWVQMFDDGSASQRDLLGGKGANLAEMTRMGLPVPPGFTITTEACRASMRDDGRLPSGLMDEVRAAVHELEERRGTTFASADAPLLISVRSGAKFSMPGMMDTVLNLGLTPAALPALAARTNGPWFAQDARRRFLDQFARVVLDVPDEVIASAGASLLARQGVDDPSGLDVAGLEELSEVYEVAIGDHTGNDFPWDPWTQLEMAISAVFRSWNGRRARTYRRLNDISDELGTAVNVQSMVFGNAGDSSGTGVAFTRDPGTGQAEPFGDFLLSAQGEDVVAGIRNTEPLARLADHFPACNQQLHEVFARLEQRYRDMCDIEFTIEEGELFILQTRVGKRSAAAALRMAVEMVDEGLIDRATAVGRFSTEQLDRLLHPRFDLDAEFSVVTTGLGASPGAASGEVVFTADEAEARAAVGDAVILVREQTSPEDLHGLVSARGVLTSRGGLVSHAAVVARGIGTPAVCGAADVVIDLDAGEFRVGDVVVRAGDVVSIDGTSGAVVVGPVPVVAPDAPKELARLLEWADEIASLSVWANADVAPDARTARDAGACGIGLCRTEHQFLGDRLPLIQRVILATSEADEAAALEDLYTRQHQDFAELLEAMDGLPVTVRLLDPPLHEFLPDLGDLLVAQASDGLDDEGLKALAAVRAWHEENPMLGIRGVRLGLLRPRLYAMQVRALLDAAVEHARAGGSPQVRIMVPLVATEAELQAAIAAINEVAEAITLEPGELGVRWQIGAMVETPRAALVAGKIAAHVDFLSFGTNDLTQMTFGFSRDDVEARLMPLYVSRGLLPEDPFGSLDVEGVGRLVAMAVDAARSANPAIDIGVCGEHGGDPASIAFFDHVGLDEVSCSPYRVPVARLAAAQAVLGDDAGADR